MKGLRKTTAKTITLNTDLISELEDMAIVENRNFSNMVETLLIEATRNKIRKT